MPTELEYPKKRIFTIEIEPSTEYLMSSGEAFYDKEESHFTVVNRVMLFKKFHSRAEECYFMKSLASSKENMSLFRMGMFGFKCPICKSLHSAKLLTSQYFTPMTEEKEEIENDDVEINL